MNGDAVLAPVHRCQHAVDAFAELVAIGEAGQVVVFGEMRDALLRPLAFRHVFENDDRATAGHRPARYRDGSIAIR